MSTTLKRLSQNEIIRFVLSAGVGFLVDILCFFLFYHNIFEQHSYLVFGHSFRNYTISLGVSFFLGVMVNFLMTRYIVFTESRSRFSKQLIRFLLVAFVGFFANQLVLQLMVSQLNIYPPLARILAALSLFFASFFIHKTFSFSLSLRKKHVAANTSSGS